MTGKILTAAATLAVMLITGEANIPSLRRSEGHAKIAVHRLGNVGSKVFYVEYPSSIQIPMNWEAARSYCQEFHLRLASIRTETERQFLHYVAASSPYHPVNGFWITTATGGGAQQGDLCPLAYFTYYGIVTVRVDCSIEGQGALCEEIEER